MLILGIDTGGTYTDGVILDRETRTVLHTAKALTTPENLSAGITACMRALRFSGWRTRVRALEIRTFGLGGDSEIVLRPDGSVRIGPRKVVPLCRAAVTAGRAGLTPTDLLHVSGTYREWDAQRARAGLREAAAACGIPAEKLERRLTDAVVRQLAADCREGAAAEAGSILIGVGAPARSWLTAAAAQLGWPCVVPRCAEAANAVGAAAGQVCESARALVRHNRLSDCFYVYTESCRMEAEHLRAAQELARGAVRRTVLEKAARAGAEAPEVTLREQLTAGEDGAFVEWCVAADAKGYPSAKYKGNPPDFTGG